MDLLALVTDDSQLSIHRLDWQKLWTASLDSPVTAMCWRPDGGSNVLVIYSTMFKLDLRHCASKRALYCCLHSPEHDPRGS